MRFFTRGSPVDSACAAFSRCHFLLSFLWNVMTLRYVVSIGSSVAARSDASWTSQRFCRFLRGAVSKFVACSPLSTLFLSCHEYDVRKDRRGGRERGKRKKIQKFAPMWWVLHRSTTCTLTVCCPLYIHFARKDKGESMVWIRFDNTNFLLQCMSRPTVPVETHLVFHFIDHNILEFKMHCYSLMHTYVLIHHPR